MTAGREQDAHWTGTEFLDAALKEPLPTARMVLENLAARDHMRSDKPVSARDQKPVPGNLHVFIPSAAVFLIR